MREYQEGHRHQMLTGQLRFLSRTVAAAEYIINRPESIRAWHRQTE